MVPDITKKIYEDAHARKKVFPCHSNRASSIGHECERYLFYQRTKWEEAQEYDTELQLIFDEGNLHEKAVLQSLAKVGVDVIEQQASLFGREHNISGHVDGVLSVDGKAVPLEIKSMSPNTWMGIFREGARRYLWVEVENGFKTKPWLRKYYAQLTVYMYLKDNDKAVLLCKNKTNGQIAQVDIYLDYEYAEKLLQKAARINRSVDADTPPEPIPFSNEICRDCVFNHLCCPDEIAKDPYQTISDEQLLTWCETEYNNAEAAKERTKARKELGAFCKANNGTSRFIVGPYRLEYTGNKRKTVTVDKIQEGDTDENS